MKGCGVQGCKKLHEARGFCAKHYQRLKATGTPTGLKINRRDTLAETLACGYFVSKSGCWLWRANLTEQGYGILSFRGKRRMAHRESFKLHKGSIPRRLQVNHRCDRPACVNPKHLYLGTQKENIADMLRRGRTNRKGERCHGRRVLTPANVLAIRKSRDTQAVLAATFGVTPSNIGAVRQRISWRHF